MIDQEIDVLCDQFENALNGSEPQSIRMWMNRLPGKDASVLFEHLLELELEYLFRRGQTPVAECYARDYPEFSALIKPVFARAKRRLAQLVSPRENATESPKAKESKHLQPDATGLSAVILRVTDGPTTGKEWRFHDHQTFVAGRSRQAHLRLSPNREFSRFHCRLEIKPPQAVIVDLGSTNGTRVNGRRVESTVLQHGDEVSVGDVRFEIHLENIDPPNTVVLQPTFVPLSGHSEYDAFQDLPAISEYQIERKLGQGAMGCVYFGRRVATNTPVALKFLVPAVAADRKSLDRFRREASIGLRLQHKRIVRCLDFGFSNNHMPYIVMEYIPELNRREVFAGLPESERIRISVATIVRVLEGLRYAHKAEIVHRDLKPSNLLMFRSGQKLRVKIGDFGLAKNYIDAGFSNFSISKEFCGTLSYMAPEQVIDCRYAKPSCDIYAAGVCLYHLMSGRLPFEAEAISYLIAKVLNDSPVPIQQYLPAIDQQLAKTIHKAIEKDPDNRFSTADSMLEALLPFTRRY